MFAAKFIFIILFMVNGVQSERHTMVDLKNVLTKKNSMKWLSSLNSINGSNNPYCHLCCINIDAETVGKHCGSHTLCKYPTNQTGPACRGYIAIEFSNIEKEAIVDIHNTLRNIVAIGKESSGSPGPQPTAANMRAVQWNNELAFIAKRWAAQCIYANDVCRDLERFPVGQNIAHGNFATNNELSFIKEWYDEVLNFNKSHVASFQLLQQNKNVFNSYSQVIWADTYEIGCARAVFQVSRGPHVIYREHFICNYGPTGNIPNQPVYQIGNPCTACHEGTSCLVEYPALCGGEMISNIERIPEREEVRDKRRNIIVEPLEASSKNKLRLLAFPHLLCLEIFYLYTILY